MALCCFFSFIHHKLLLITNWTELVAGRMPSSVMLHHVALVRTYVSKDCIASIITVTRNGELGTTLAVTSNRSMLQRNTITANIVTCMAILVTLMMGAIHSSRMSGLTRATWHNITEDNILHSHRHKNLKSYFVPGILFKASRYWKYYLAKP
jgi:hypothetical protein